jgi:hypothetical protein
MDDDAPPMTLATFGAEASKLANEMLERKGKKTAKPKGATKTPGKRKAPAATRKERVDESRSVTSALALLSKRHKAAKQADCSAAAARPADAGPSSSSDDHFEGGAPLIHDGSDESDESD